MGIEMESLVAGGSFSSHAVTDAVAWHAHRVRVGHRCRVAVWSLATGMWPICTDGNRLSSCMRSISSGSILIGST